MGMEDLDKKIISLYVDDEWSPSRISSHFGGRPTRSGVRYRLAKYNIKRRTIHESRGIKQKPKPRIKCKTEKKKKVDKREAPNRVLSDEVKGLIETHFEYIKKNISRLLIVKYPGARNINDLIDIGISSIPFAALNYDPKLDKKKNFANFVVQRVLLRIIDEIRDNSIHTRTIYEQMKTVNMFMDNVVKQKGFVTVDDVIDEINKLDVSDKVKKNYIAYGFTNEVLGSLDFPVWEGEGETITVGDTIVDKKPVFSKLEWREVIKKALDKIETKYNGQFTHSGIKLSSILKIILLRNVVPTCLNSGGYLKISEIGDMFNLTESRISNIKLECLPGIFDPLIRTY